MLLDCDLDAIQPGVVHEGINPEATGHMSGREVTHRLDSSLSESETLRDTKPCSPTKTEYLPQLLQPNVITAKPD
jgi:hypothetical protein